MRLLLLLALAPPCNPTAWGGASLSRSSAQEVLGVVSALRGGGYAYQKKGARINAIRHTPGQVHTEEQPRLIEPEIARTFELDAQKWNGFCEDPAELFGKTGAPPLPERVPEVVLLALGTRINSPIQEKIATAWVLATDKRLITRMSAPREEEITPNICATCLGPTPETVKMIRHLLGTECKICKNSYTVYHWRPGTVDVRLKVTQRRPAQAASASWSLRQPRRIERAALAPLPPRLRSSS